MLLPRVDLTAFAISRNGGQITVSQCLEEPNKGRKDSKKEVVPRPFLCIFQFPPIRGARKAGITLVEPPTLVGLQVLLHCNLIA